MGRICVCSLIASVLIAGCGEVGDPGKKAATPQAAAPKAAPSKQSAPDPDDLRFKPTLRLRAQGRYEGPAVLAYKQSGGSGEVTDSLTLEFTVDLDKGKLVGPVAITNGTTEVKRIFHPLKDCSAPVLTGRYEYFTGEKAAMLNEAVLQIDGTQSHADMKVNTLCPSSMALTAIAAKDEPAIVYLPLFDPRAIRMGYVKDVVMGADGRSYSSLLKGGDGKPSDNWRWEVAFEILSIAQQ